MKVIIRFVHDSYTKDDIKIYLFERENPFPLGEGMRAKK